MQRMRIRYAKRGPLRFSSHRDVARAFERAVRRAGLPIAYSQGFTPHPKISYAGAAPTGAASEAEYLELGLHTPISPEALVSALDAALSPGLDVLDAVIAAGGGPSLADRIDASRWRIELPGVTGTTAAQAVAALLAAPEVVVSRLMKQGWRRFDVRGAVVALTVVEPQDHDQSRRTGSAVPPSATSVPPCAILDLVVRQGTPTVRPDDVLAGLTEVSGLELAVPPLATRLAQGALTAQGEIVDPLAADHEGTIRGIPSGLGGT
jgi:radical SAM-linked protein